MANITRKGSEKQRKKKEKKKREKKAFEQSTEVRFESCSNFICSLCNKFIFMEENFINKYG